MTYLVSRAGIAYAVQCLTMSWTPFEIAVAPLGEMLFSRHADNRRPNDHRGSCRGRKAAVK
jgi:hypothetical protein